MPACCLEVQEFLHVHVSVRGFSSSSTDVSAGCPEAHASEDTLRYFALDSVGHYCEGLERHLIAALQRERTGYSCRPCDGGIWLCLHSWQVLPGQCRCATGPQKQAFPSL